MKVILGRGFAALCCMLALGAFLSELLWAEDPALNCVVTGSLKIQGLGVQPGTDLAAYINGEQVASATTSVEGQYRIVIPKYDPSQPATKGFRSESDIVVIKVGHNEAEPRFHPRVGELKIDLEVKTSLDVKLTTWGKIKALFK